MSKNMTPEHKANLSKALKARWQKRKEEGYECPSFSEETKKRMSLAKKGISKSDSHREAMSISGKAAWANGKHEQRPILTCPHCGKQGRQRHSMAKKHFDNCSKKP